jgi:hypothetical protein
MCAAQRALWRAARGSPAGRGVAARGAHVARVACVEQEWRRGWAARRERAQGRVRRAGPVPLARVPRQGGELSSVCASVLFCCVRCFPVTNNQSSLPRTALCCCRRRGGMVPRRVAPAPLPASQGPCRLVLPAQGRLYLVRFVACMRACGCCLVVCCALRLWAPRVECVARGLEWGGARLVPIHTVLSACGAVGLVTAQRACGRVVWVVVLRSVRVQVLSCTLVAAPAGCVAVLPRCAVRYTGCSSRGRKHCR